MNGVSVVICCFNSANRLPQTLSFLARQHASCSWQIIVVNNASTDSTKDVAVKEWKKYNVSEVQLTVVDEPTPGLNFARVKGIEQSSYDFIVLCDDDNYLDEGYVQQAYKLMTSNENAGLAGGLISPLYEVEPPQWFHRHAHYLAIGPQAEQEGDITDYPGILYGAGLVIRREGYLKLKALNFKPVFSDRLKGSLLSGGDTELCFAFRLIGYRLYYSRELKMQHFMPSERLTWSYLSRLHYAMGQSSIFYVAYYEHLLKHNSKAPRGIKKTWWWQYLTTFKELIKNLLSKRNGSEGDEHSLHQLFLKGRLQSTRALRSELYKSYQRVDQFVSEANKDILIG